VHAYDSIDCGYGCKHTWNFYGYRYRNLLALLDHYIPLQWECDYEVKREQGESEQQYDLRRKLNSHVDLDAAIALYKYPVSKEQVQIKLDVVRVAVRAKFPPVANILSCGRR